MLNIFDALQIFSDLRPKTKITIPPALIPVLPYSIDYTDPIFDGLKADYPKFMDWINSKVYNSERPCWIYRYRDNSLGAVLICKIENNKVKEVHPILPKKNANQEICTFVVTNMAKIGELFIRMVIDLAIKNRCDEIYYTHFSTEDDYLVRLISQFGFNKVGIIPEKDRNEDVYVKSIVFPLTKSQLPEI